MMCTSRSRRNLWAVLLVATVSAQAGEPPASKPNPEAQVPTTVTAEKMTVRNQESKAIFEGNVVLTKGALVVHSDVMVVYFKPAPPAGAQPQKGAVQARPGSASSADPAPRGGANQLPVLSNRTVNMIEATGRVVIEKDEGRATCTKAVYFQDDEKIVLTGNPVAWQKGTRVSGKKITMFLVEDRSVVEGQSRVLFQPEEGGGG